MDGNMIKLPEYYSLFDHISVNNGYISGLVTKKSLDYIMEQHCSDTCHHYIASHLTDFEKRHMNYPGALPRLMWQYKSLPFNGFPFKVKAYKEFRCQFGMPYGCGEKYNSGNTTVEEEHSYRRKKRKCYLEKEKPTCPAKIKYREIIRYIDYGVNENEKRISKFNCLDRLKASLLRGDQVRTDVMYHLHMPLDSTHCHSTAVKVHPVIIDKIKEIFTNETTELKKIKSMVHRYAAEELKMNSDIKCNENQTFYPGLREIRRTVRRIQDAGDVPKKLNVKLNDTSNQSILVELPQNEYTNNLLATDGIEIFTVSSENEVNINAVQTDIAHGSFYKNIPVEQYSGDFGGDTLNIVLQEADDGGQIIQLQGEEIFDNETQQIIVNSIGEQAFIVHHVPSENEQFNGEFVDQIQETLSSSVNDQGIHDDLLLDSQINTLIVESKN